MANDDAVSAILQARCGALTLATLTDGRTLEIYNIAWGRDMGEAFDHITTNMSPAPDAPHTLDFFTTDKVVQLVSGDTNSVLYRKDADGA